MSRDRARDVVAFGLAGVGLVCASWLLVKAFGEIRDSGQLPARGVR